MAWGPTSRAPSAPDLPFVFVNFAMTSDGKIAPANRRFESFSSRRDQLLLYELRTYADAVMSGARTLDVNRVKLGNGGGRFTRLRLQRGLDKFPVRIVVSGRGTIDPGAEIFKHRFSPIILLASQEAPERRLKRLRSQVDDIIIFGEHGIDFLQALRWLRAKWGVKSLLCEGGGAVNAALFEARLVQRLYLTICPCVFGGRDAPTLADGRGVASLAEAARMTLHRMRRMGDELFLIYRASIRASRA